MQKPPTTIQAYKPLQSFIESYDLCSADCEAVATVWYLRHRWSIVGVRPTSQLVYLPWIDSITHVKAGEKEEIELSLNSNYENVWRVLKERLDEPAVRLKSQYSSRLYLWAKQYIVVGQKRVSVGTLRKILGLEDVKDNSGRVVQDAPLELWANASSGRLTTP